MMNTRTQDHIDEVKEILSELRPMYDQGSNTLQEPPDLIAKNQIVQFKSLLTHLEKALVNLYTDDPDAQEQIGSHLVTITNLQQACKEIGTEYKTLYAFYRNQLHPLATELLAFCDNVHTELPTVEQQTQQQSTEEPSTYS